MRKLVTWLLVTLGIAALVRKLRRRDEPQWVAEPATTPEPTPSASETTTTPEATPRDPMAQGASSAETAADTPAETAAEGEDDPAAVLREKLARSRADMPSSDEDSVEERRSAIHEQGRAALDEMKPPDGPDDGER